MSEDAAAFVERFGAIWTDPSPERINELLHPDVRLVQPLEDEVRGLEDAAAMWRRTFGLIPDLHGEVVDWAARDGYVVISLRLYGTLGGRPFEWTSSDHIRLVDGRIKERVARFDPLPLVAAVLTRPRAWPAFARFQRERLRG